MLGVSLVVHILEIDGVEAVMWDRGFDVGAVDSGFGRRGGMKKLLIDWQREKSIPQVRWMVVLVMARLVDDLRQRNVFGEESCQSALDQVLSGSRVRVVSAELTIAGLLLWRQRERKMDFDVSRSWVVTRLLSAGLTRWKAVALAFDGGLVVMWDGGFDVEVVGLGWWWWCGPERSTMG